MFSLAGPEQVTIYREMRITMTGSDATLKPPIAWSSR